MPSACPARAQRVPRPWQTSPTRPSTRRRSRVSKPSAPASARRGRLRTSWLRTEATQQAGLCEGLGLCVLLPSLSKGNAVSSSYAVYVDDDRLAYPPARSRSVRPRCRQAVDVCSHSMCRFLFFVVVQYIFRVLKRVPTPQHRPRGPGPRPRCPQLRGPGRRAYFNLYHGSWPGSLWSQCAPPPPSPY